MTEYRPEHIEAGGQIIASSRRPTVQLGEMKRYATIVKTTLGYHINLSCGRHWLFTEYEIPAFRFTRWGAERKARRYLRKFDKQHAPKNEWRIE